MSAARFTLQGHTLSNSGTGTVYTLEKSVYTNKNNFPYRTIWKATRYPQNDNVAVKIIERAPDHLLSPYYRTQYTPESYLEKTAKDERDGLNKLGQLTGSTRLQDFGMIDASRWVLVDSWLEGVTVSQALSDPRHGMTNPQAASQIFDQVKEQLTRLHNAGISHGDASTENFMVVSNGSSIKVHVIDMGGSGI